MNFKYLVFVFLVQVPIIYVNANDFWKRDYSRIDSIARTIKPTTNLEKLASRLTSNCESDVEKYRAIYTWIAINIGYDLNGLRDRTKRETNPEKVVKNGLAVCAGYASLFQKLCTLVNLKSEVINGTAKRKEMIGKPLIPDHAWNAIQIDSAWYLCDVTWGSCSVTENFKSVDFDFKSYYFCTPPELFSCDHFPEDKKWLLEAHISKKEFSNRPHFYPTAIDLNLREVSPEDGIIKYKEGKVISFKFRVDSPVARISIMPDNSKISEYIIVKQDDQGAVRFDYTLKKYSMYLTFYLRGRGVLVYKLSK
jgi:transglutaminase/protease-like cytokinesis protein 3